MFLLVHNEDVPEEKERERDHRRNLKSNNKSQHVFSHMWKIDPKDKYIRKIKHDHIQRYNVEPVSNSGTTLWNSGKEKKEKGILERHICEGRGYKDIY
jgi:hypothetical protein